MIHLTVNLGMFFKLLIEQIFWTGVTIGGWLLAALVPPAAILFFVLRTRAKRRER